MRNNLTPNTRKLTTRSRSSYAFFNVRSFGAGARGDRDDTGAFRASWKEACRSNGTVYLLVPKGTYLVGPVKFSGPCQNVSSLIIQMEGHLKATTNLSKYGHNAGWIEFRRVNGLILRGGGTFDGQGVKAWPFNKCSSNSTCKLLPTNLKFVAMNKTVVKGIRSVDSKFFHIAVVECSNFRGTRIKISAPANSPNTDGIHIERSSAVYLSRSFIGTGDDCISVGQGNSQITITNIICGPGHGIRSAVTPITAGEYTAASF